MTRSSRLRAVLALGLASAASVVSVAQRPSVHEIRVEARKFEFDPAVIEVTAGEPVRLVLHSSDTTHGFEIRDLELDVEIPRTGDTVTAEFTAPPPGRYSIACSEMCGRGHRHMKAALVSVPAH
jgi:cytochrome c oxidase subunit 2